MKLRLIADRHHRMTDNDRGLMNAKLSVLIRVHQRDLKCYEH
jgi:hypothetical protein